MIMDVPAMSCRICLVLWEVLRSWGLMKETPHLGLDKNLLNPLLSSRSTAKTTIILLVLINLNPGAGLKATRKGVG